MKRIVLNGEYMETIESSHSYLKDKLDLPDYYGKNLDALWDLLSTHGDKTRIELMNSHILVENLGDYGQSIIELFKEAGEENPNIEILII